MSQSKLIDVAAGMVRISAALSATAFSLIVLMLGVMANDSGTPAGERASAIVLVIGALIVLWTLLCSIAPGVVSSWFPWGPARFVLVHGPVLVFGLGGLTWIAAWSYSKFGFGIHLSQEVRPAEKAYPVINPAPSQWLEIHGTLPKTVPVNDVEETFMTAAAADDGRPDSCHRVFPPGRSVEPIVKHETVPVSSASGRYAIRLPVDRYLPGKCGWQLRSVDFRLLVANSGIRGANVEVVVPTEQEKAARNNGNFYQGPLEIWCGAALNKKVTPYYPVVCGSWNTMSARIPSEQADFIAPQGTDAHETTWVMPGTHSIEINFHDADAPESLTAPPAM